MEDIQLIEKIKDSDYNAFEILFERYYSFLCNYASNIVKDNYTAEDIVQEVFVRIWETRNTANIKSSVKSYLFTAVKNKCLNKIEEEAIRKKYTNRFATTQDTKVFQTEIEQAEFKEHLFSCIQKLPPRCKDIFIESRFQGTKQAEIAEKMYISIKTVKAQIGKAVRFVQSCLGNYYPKYF